MACTIEYEGSNDQEVLESVVAHLIDAGAVPFVRLTATTPYGAESTTITGFLTQYNKEGRVHLVDDVASPTMTFRCPLSAVIALTVFDEETWQ